MSPPAVASAVFGVYAASMGVLLAVAPNPVTGLFGLPPTEEPWIRVVAAMALALGAYYLTAAREELVPFFRASVPGRLAFAGVVTFAAASSGWWPLLIFAAIDLVSAGITAWLLAKR